MRLNFLERSIIGAVVVALAIGLVFKARRDKPMSDIYFVARESVEQHVAPRGVFRFTSPSDIHFEPVDARATNVFGWVISTNRSGSEATQWFRCTIKNGGATDLKMFLTNPLGETIIIGDPKAGPSRLESTE